MCVLCFADSSCAVPWWLLYCLTTLTLGSQAGCWGVGSGSPWGAAEVPVSECECQQPEQFSAEGTVQRGGKKNPKCLQPSISLQQPRHQRGLPVHAATLPWTFHSVLGSFYSQELSDWIGSTMTPQPVGNTDNSLVSGNSDWMFNYLLSWMRCIWGLLSTPFLDYNIYVVIYVVMCWKSQK